MPDGNDRREIRVLEIEISEKIDATLYRWDRGDSMERISESIDYPLNIESERENIESLHSLVRIVTAIYRQRQYQHTDDEYGDDLLEQELRIQLNGLIKVLGRQLYRVLFRDKLHQLLVENLNLNLSLFRIELKFVRNQELERWPWEYIYIPKEDAVRDSDRFLALIAQLALNRRWVTTSREKLHVTGPINILLVVSSPVDLQPLDGGSVKTAIQQSFPGATVDDTLCERNWDETDEKDPVVTYDAFLKKISSDELPPEQASPAQTRWNVIHLMAHGRLSSGGLGQLAFAGKGGKAQWISGADLAEGIRDRCVKWKSLKIVFLQACESALPGSFVGISSVAQHLARVDVPAVIGMQGEIVQGEADAFASAFYRSIADRASVDFAVKQGRLAIAPPSREEYLREAFGLPVLYLSSYTSLLPEPAVGVDRSQPIPQALPQFAEVTCPRCLTKSAAKVCLECGFVLYCHDCGHPIKNAKQKYCQQCYPPRPLEHAPYDAKKPSLETAF